MSIGALERASGDTATDGWEQEPAHEAQRSQQNWYDGPAVLSTMLALCDPPGWDQTPPQRAARRNGVTNALRLWSVIGSIARHGDGRLDSVHVTADKGMWEWSRWRRGESPRDGRVDVRLIFKSGPLGFVIRAHPEAVLLRNLQAQLLASPDIDSDHPMHWCLRPREVRMTYPQVRAFIAALAFSTSTSSLSIDTHVPAASQSA